MSIIENQHSQFCDQPSTIHFRSVHILKKSTGTTTLSYDSVVYTGTPLLQLTDSTEAMVVYILPSRYLIFRVSLRESGPSIHSETIAELVPYLVCCQIPVSSIEHRTYPNDVGLFRKLTDTQCSLVHPNPVNTSQPTAVDNQRIRTQSGCIHSECDNNSPTHALYNIPHRPDWYTGFGDNVTPHTGVIDHLADPIDTTQHVALTNTSPATHMDEPTPFRRDRAPSPPQLHLFTPPNPMEMIRKKIHKKRKKKPQWHSVINQSLDSSLAPPEACACHVATHRDF
jgi:hypothetical protein